MSTSDPLTLLRGVHTHVHMHTHMHRQSWGDIGLQDSLLWPQKHSVHEAALPVRCLWAWHQGESPGSSSSSSDSLGPKPIIPGRENDSLVQRLPSADGRGAGRWPWWWLEGRPGTKSRRVRGGQWRRTNAMGTVGFEVGRRWMTGRRGRGGPEAGPLLNKA